MQRSASLMPGSRVMTCSPNNNPQLSERLETRKILDRAKGILQRDLSITEEEAYLTIQRQSRQRRKTKKEIAEAIILGDELRRGKQ